MLITTQTTDGFETSRIGEEHIIKVNLELKNKDMYVTGWNARLLSKDMITEFHLRDFKMRMSP